MIALLEKSQQKWMNNMGNSMQKTTRRLGILVLAMVAIGLTACATPRIADTPIDWGEADARWSIQIVTVDPDGGDRVTRIWMAMLEGQAVLRTNDSRWWANLQRDSRIRMRHEGREFAFDVENVAGAADRVAIDEVFLEKYNN